MAALGFTISIKAGVLMTFAAVLYLCISATVYLLFKPNIMRNLVDFGAEYSQVQRKMIRDMEVPYCLLDESGKVMWTNSEMDKICEKNIRNKLMSYFMIEAKKNGSDTFELPFSMSALADYICVDRSAMVREISKMKKDGLIDSDRRKITLLDRDDI